MFCGLYHIAYRREGFNYWNSRGILGFFLRGIPYYSVDIVKVRERVPYCRADVPTQGRSNRSTKDLIILCRIGGGYDVCAHHSVEFPDDGNTRSGDS